MFVWSGLGILTPLLAFGCIFALELLFPRAHYNMPIGLVIAAAANWFIGRSANSQEGRTLRDENTGETFQYKRRHTAFWLRMEWWSIAMILTAVLYLATT